MSGLVAMFNRDGAPVDPALLDRMTAYLTFRGADARRAVALNHAGLGHTLLTIDEASDREQQPFSLDGRQWIVADARIDARDDLIAKLEARGQDAVARDATDVELILRSYRAWDEECVTHLLGDFTFAVWDPSRQRLFCARDQLGVKPLFYAQVGRLVIVSNTLDCVRLHPAVSREIHEPAIADFLLFGFNPDGENTTFRDIRRLPPGHCITWTADAARCRRYWTLPVDDPIHFTRADEYSERFTELLRLALGDRLRTRRVGVLMSGGVDSPALAAAALSVLRERSGSFHLQAITSVYDRLIPDSERHYASLVADHLDIPIRFDVRDDELSIAEWDRVSIHTPEPVDNPPARAASVQFLRTMAADARLFLYGEGPDAALRYEWRQYLAHLLATRRVTPLVRAAWNELSMHRRIPFWSSIRHIVSSGRTAQPAEPFPSWLDEGFAERCECRARWDGRRRPVPSPHRIRPAGYNAFSDVRWHMLFEECDLHGALSRTEIRHPFLDLRLLRYMLAVPAMPWCRNKLIIRRSMRTALPRTVLHRRKASVAASPDFERVKASGFPRLVASPDLARFVNPDKIPAMPANAGELRSALRPLGLNAWLHDLTRH